MPGRQYSRPAAASSDSPASVPEFRGSAGCAPTELPLSQSHAAESAGVVSTSYNTVPQLCIDRPKLHIISVNSIVHYCTTVLHGACCCCTYIRAGLGLPAKGRWWRPSSRPPVPEALKGDQVASFLSNRRHRRSIVQRPHSMATTTRIALARSVAVLLLIQTALIALTAVSASASSQPDDHLADLPTSQLLAQADTLLSSGKGGDALELYNVLVERDSSSYVSRRAHALEPNTFCPPPAAAARVGFRMCRRGKCPQVGKQPTATEGAGQGRDGTSSRIIRGC